MFAAPFFVLVGGGGSSLRRTVSAAVGAVLPVAALLAYTWLTTGSVLHPGYDYQYQLEANGYPTLGYHPEWAVEDLRYVPQNLGIMLGALPEVMPAVKPDTLGVYPTVMICSAPGASRGLFDAECPLALPIDIGTSVLLSLARAAARAVRDPAPSDRSPHARIRADRPRHRPVQPRPLQPGLGPVGLPVLARLHPVPAAPRRARRRPRR